MCRLVGPDIPQQNLCQLLGVARAKRPDLQPLDPHPPPFERPNSEKAFKQGFAPSFSLR